MSVLNRIAKLAQAAQPSRAERDAALWRQWRKTKANGDLSLLLNQVNPLIQREVNRWAGSLARPLLEAEGKRLAVTAFENYDPNRGAALGTHVANSLQKMSRLSYANQNVARLPENKMLMFHSYNLAHSQLKDTLGRTPSTDELADHLGWSIKHLTNFRKDISRQELLESGGNAEHTGPLFEADETDHTVDFIHHDLPPTQKLIFEHLTGYGGAKQLDNQEIMKHLDLTQGQYSYQKRLLIEHIEKTTGGK